MKSRFLNELEYFDVVSNICQALRDGGGGGGGGYGGHGSSNVIEYSGPHVTVRILAVAGVPVHESVGPGSYYSSRPPPHFIPSFLSLMASYDLASDICQALRVGQNGLSGGV